MKSAYVHELHEFKSCASDSFYNPRFFMRPNREDVPNKVILAPAGFEGPLKRRGKGAKQLSGDTKISFFSTLRSV